MAVDELLNASCAVTSEFPVDIGVSEHVNVRYSEDILIRSMRQHVKNHTSAYTFSHRVIDKCRR